MRPPLSLHFRRCLSLSSYRSHSRDVSKLLLYDTRTRSKRPLSPVVPGLLKWYQCGPTVYADSHIGHAATYVRFDVIRRILSQYFNYHVILAMCITDIDDKIIAAANKQSIPFARLARKYEKDFFADMDRLNVLRPSIILRVSEHIPQVIEFVQRAIDNNLAYIVDDASVYFDVAAYGSRYNVFKDLQTAAPDAVPVEGKRSAADFALWKSAKPGEPSWPVVWKGGKSGRGRPGWHIECSTLSTLAFGNRLDLHSGGEDLIFPHHQNEVAQCVAAGCVPSPDLWVGHWLHSGHLHMPSSGTEEKMSKSLGNTISISHMLSGKKLVGDISGVSSAEFRVLTCLCHYRDRIAITPPKLLEAKNTWRRIEEFASMLQAWANNQLTPSSSAMLSEANLLQRLEVFKAKLDVKLADDVDTPGAFKELDSLIADLNRTVFPSSKGDSTSDSFATSSLVPLSYLEVLYNFTSLFGLPNSGKVDQSSPGDQADVKNGVDKDFVEALTVAVEFRSAVRRHALNKTSNAQDLLKICDQFRSNLGSLGFTIKIFGRGRLVLAIDHTHVASPKGLLPLLPHGENTQFGISGVHKMLCDVIDGLGQASARAQGLPLVITSASKLVSCPDQKIYLLIDPNVDRFVGLLKIGRKRLFLSDPRRTETIDMAMVECQPLCILDFYVVEGQQRRGLGRRLCDSMISAEGASIGHIAVDRPSPKMISFLAKNYGLTKPFLQRNNFTVFEHFFSSNNPALASRIASGYRRNLRKSFSSDCIAGMKSAFATATQHDTGNNNVFVSNPPLFQQQQQPQLEEQQRLPPRTLPPLSVPYGSYSRAERYMQPQSADVISKNKQQQQQQQPMQAHSTQPPFRRADEPPLLTRDVFPDNYRQLFSADNVFPKLYNRNNNNNNYPVYSNSKPAAQPATTTMNGYFYSTDAKPPFNQKQAMLRANFPSSQGNNNNRQAASELPIGHYFANGGNNNNYRYPRPRPF